MTDVDRVLDDTVVEMNLMEELRGLRVALDEAHQSLYEARK